MPTSEELNKILAALGLDLKAEPGMAMQDVLFPLLVELASRTIEQGETIRNLEQQVDALFYSKT